MFRWDGLESRWGRQGPSVGNQTGLLATDLAGQLYVSGYFDNADGERVNGVARWNADLERWDMLGSGMDSSIRALATDAAGNVYAAGWFSSAGGVPANKVARWNVASGRWEALGVGINDSRLVEALTIDSAGNVYVGGDFTLSGA